jgi:hypothetical protein
VDQQPDAPLRAVRQRDGSILAVASDQKPRLLRGPDVDHLGFDCRIVLPAEPGPDRRWLHALYALDDGRLVGMLHDEFQGHRDASLCPSGHYRACWWNSVDLAVSTDGGASFQRQAAPVAALAMPYQGDVGRPVGYFNPSNILAWKGLYYMAVFAEGFGAQQRGICMLRASDPGRPDSWMAWNGADFAVRLGGPGSAKDQAGICSPVSPGNVQASLMTIAQITGQDLFVGIVGLGATAGRVGGFYAVTSHDLVHWSKPSLIFEAPLMFKFTCSDDFAFAYPSLIDEGSASRNFETIGSHVSLYLTRIRLANCHIGPSQDLVRIPFDISQ